jgi:uncharacterized protein (TIGR03067 family)
MGTGLFVAFGLSFFLSTDMKGISVPKELRGSWTWESLDTGAGIIDMDTFARCQIISFMGDKLVFQTSTRRIELALKRIDPKKTPKEVDFKTKKGVDRGIYKVDRDVLTICCGGKDRPKDFKRQRGRLIYVFKRKKD